MIGVVGGDLCAVGLPGKKIVSVLGQTSKRTNPIVTRLSEGRVERVDRPTSGGEVAITGELLGRKLISGSDQSSFAEVYSNKLSSISGVAYRDVP